MHSKLLRDHGGEKTIVMIFDTGDEVTSLLVDFAKEQRLAGARFTAIGALKDVVLGYFDWEKKAYLKIPISEQVEVLSLMGDIALSENGDPKVHAHVVVGRSDGTTRGGHLIEAHVRPTLELILVESPAHLRRKHDPESGLALIRL